MNQPSPIKSPDSIQDTELLMELARDLRQATDALVELCRQLYEAEQTKNQQDWTAVIRALEKVGADSTAPNAGIQGLRSSPLE